MGQFNKKSFRNIINHRKWEGGTYMTTEEKRRELFCEPVSVPEKPKKVKEIIGASDTELVNQLSAIQSATVHFDVFSAISALAQEKQLNIYVFRRSHVGIHYKPRNRYFYTVVATKAGTPKATQLKAQEGVVAQIPAFPRQVNHRRSSGQYKALREFEQAIASVE